MLESPAPVYAYQFTASVACKGPPVRFDLLHVGDHLQGVILSKFGDSIMRRKRGLINRAVTFQAFSADPIKLQRARFTFMAHEQGNFTYIYVTFCSSIPSPTSLRTR